VELFRELLFTWNHLDVRARNASELKPIPRIDDFKRLYHRVPNSYIKIEI
jgi:hypothetical protein